MSLNAADDHNAELIYHCGIALEMEYTLNWSGSWLKDSEDALENYFGYKTDADFKKRSLYIPSWESLP